MISGIRCTVKRTESRQRFAIAVLVFALTAPAMHADAWRLSDLMQLLARNKSGNATFVEKKYIGILDQQIVATGDLSFVAPDKLEKRTLTPKPETLTLDGDRLTIVRPGKQPIKVSLDDHPEVAAMIESIRGTLAGDLSALESFYALELAGTVHGWQLTLKPKQEKLASIFDHIVIRGVQADIRTIDLEQRDGDHSEMIITQSWVDR
jgi:outer membrane lipoprotein-sorting protein